MAYTFLHHCTRSLSLLDYHYHGNNKQTMGMRSPLKVCCENENNTTSTTTTSPINQRACNVNPTVAQSNGSAVPALLQKLSMKKKIRSSVGVKATYWIVSDQEQKTPSCPSPKHSTQPTLFLMRYISVCLLDPSL